MAESLGLLLAAPVILLAMQASGAPAPASTQRANPAAVRQPPISWVCPMHPEIVDNQSGTCPLCRMPLAPVRLALVWTCPEHREIATPDRGVCRACDRDLVPVVRALSWTCRRHPAVDVLDAGRCTLCKAPLTARYSERPHGDHNPRHGGLFFMASNDWHVEATYPAPGVVRLYVYDEYSRPALPAALSARLELPGVPGRSPADSGVAFRRVPNGGFVEARASTLRLPAAVVVKVRFKAGEPEHRFDFQFAEYSKAP